MLSPISGSTSVAGVIGWPVEHSRSPAIHAAAIAACGVDMVYVAFPVRPGAGAAAADAVRTLGLRGLSVTMPHKADVIASLDELSPEAERLGAVNTIVNLDGHLVGHNTDGAGFLRGLEHDAGIGVQGRSIAVVGSGGAARAIVGACADAGAATVGVLARSGERAAAAAALAGAAGVVLAPLDLADAQLVVNATPLGMGGTEQADDVPFDVSTLATHTVVVDIVYEPELTPLRKAAAARGIAHHGGLSMLVGQAIEQFEAWTGRRPDFEPLLAAARG